MARRTSKHTSMSKRYSNPKEFIDEMVQLASQSPQDAAEVAATWRDRFHNVTESTGELVQKGAQTTLTGLTAFVMAMWEGRNEAAADAIVDQWLASPEAAAAAAEAGVDLAAMSDYDREKFAFDKMEDNDPRKIPVIGFDWIWSSTAFLAAISAFGLAGEAVSPWVGHAAMGSFTAALSSIGYRVGKNAKEQSLAAAALEA